METKPAKILKQQAQPNKDFAKHNAVFWYRYKRHYRQSKATPQNKKNMTLSSPLFLK